MQRLNDLFPDWLTGTGIFNILDGLDGVALPWAEDIDPDSLDFEYHGNHSGMKLVAPLVWSLQDAGTLSQANMEKIANVLVSLYLVNWTKEYATLSAQYNPINNYEMTEQETGNNSATSSVTHTGTDNRSLSNPQTNTHEVYAFNSTAYAPSERDSITSTGTDNRTVNLTDGGTNSASYGRRLTRSGNIGVTTSQQMLQSERDLWRWTFFNDVVFPDIDRVLTINIY